MVGRGWVALQNDVNKGVGYKGVGRALLLGDQNAGKSSLLYRLLFPDRFELTELDQSKKKKWRCDVQLVEHESTPHFETEVHDAVQPSHTVA